MVITLVIDYGVFPPKATIDGKPLDKEIQKEWELREYDDKWLWDYVTSQEELGK